MHRLCLAAALLCLAAPLHADTPGWLDRVTCRVNHDVDEGQGKTLHQSGTGTILYPDDSGVYVLTCYHNFEEPSGRHARGKITVHCRGGKVYAGRVAARDRKHDLCLLRVTTKDKWRGARLAEEEGYAAGLKVCKAGYPEWFSLRKQVYGEGKCLDWHTVTREGVKSFACSIKSAVGDSGCGVFRASDRALVGVIRGGGEGAIAVRLEDVKAFLARAAKKDGRLAAVLDSE